MEYELSRIAAICGGKFRGCDTVVRSVVTDSRSLTCELGCSPMFVALRGANHDSHDFIAQMYDRGVRAFVVEREVEPLPGCGYAVVGNAIEALQSLAAYHRAHFKGTVVGITGSNGKTVIKAIDVKIATSGRMIRSRRSISPGCETPASKMASSSSPSSISTESGTPSCEL